MATLEQIWYESQSDLDSPALLKMADGSQQPVTKSQLMHLIHSMEPGQSITVGGLNISLTESGHIEVTSTTPSAPPSGLAKAAAQREAGWRVPSFGECLQGLHILSGGYDDV